MGFTWEHIQEINPRLIFGSIKGFDGCSPYVDVKAYENVAQTAGGAASTTGFWDGPPLVSSAALGDSNTGMHLLIGLLAVLLQREKTGRGKYVSISNEGACGMGARSCDRPGTVGYSCFKLIAQANSDVAVFAVGLTLAAHKFEFIKEIVYNTFLKLILMPLALLLIGLAFNMDSIQLQMMVLAGALPPVFSGIIIASRFNVCTRTSTASLAVSILGFVGTAPFWIYVARLVS